MMRALVAAALPALASGRSPPGGGVHAVGGCGPGGSRLFDKFDDSQLFLYQVKFNFNGINLTASTTSTSASSVVSASDVGGRSRRSLDGAPDLGLAADVAPSSQLAPCVFSKPGATRAQVRSTV